MLEKKYGKDGAKDRIFATTDKERGALKFLADQEGYETFVIPDDVGGRYSVYSAVGLLPIAVAGIDIDAFMDGAKSGYEEYGVDSVADNACYQYTLYRSCLYNRGKAIEILVDYEPSLRYFSEWWKQLYGESDGRTARACSRRRSISQPTCTLWDRLSRTAIRIFLKPFWQWTSWTAI